MHSMAKFCASSCQDVMEHPLEDNCSAAKTCLPPTEFVKTHGEDTHGPGEKLVEAWHETSSQGEPNRRASTLWSEDWLWRKKEVKIRFHRFHPWWNSRDVQVLIGLCNLCIPSYKSLSLIEAFKQCQAMSSNIKLEMFEMFEGPHCGGIDAKICYLFM